MSQYWYNNETKHLYTDKEMTHPFLCPSEVTPIAFDNTQQCLEFLSEQKIEGSVLYKLHTPQFPV
tara:strand:- start:434 stop:628 length:195 start_codon:yes stop_codon:yes gene_type:complete